MRAGIPTEPNPGRLENIPLLGIDPGLHGALAFWYPASERLIIRDMPIVNLSKSSGGMRHEIASSQLALLLSEGIAHAFLEIVGSRPKQGLAAAFNFGVGYGMLQGALAAHGIPFTFVSPTAWRGHHHIARGAGKDDSRATASRLLPRYASLFARKMDDGRAEAALIALYGASLQRGAP